MEFFQITVNDTWIVLTHKAVSKYLETWPGGDPSEQEALIRLKSDLDRMVLEVSFNKSMDA
jgi:hypothetical protein|tara:strand:- start:7008 stop:7190 length:183 start_codon:yes stop_codon:yes gene_type:complete